MLGSARRAPVTKRVTTPPLEAGDGESNDPTICLELPLEEGTARSHAGHQRWRGSRLFLLILNLTFISCSASIFHP
jgi:hypothetical protein